MHQADHDPTPPADEAPRQPKPASTLREIPDPDAASSAADDLPSNVLIVNHRVSRGISPGAALACLLLFIALGGLAVRGTVRDWQGLWTESRTRWTVHKPVPPPPAVAQATPDAPTPKAKAAESVEAADAEPVPVPDDLLAAAPQAKPEAPVLQKEEEEEAKPAPAAPPDDDTQAAMDDIQKEVERKRQEQEELDRLRKQAEREAPPPAPPGPRMFGFGFPMPANPRDREQLARMFREQQMRQIQEMERLFDEIERAQADALRGHGMAPMLPRLPRPNFGLVLPPVPHLDDGAPEFVPLPPRPRDFDLDPPPAARDFAWPDFNNRPPRDQDNGRDRPAQPNKNPLRGWQAALPGNAMPWA